MSVKATLSGVLFSWLLLIAAAYECPDGMQAIPEDDLEEALKAGKEG